MGYISSVAEFTPKTLQTEELRTSLVYEVRVLVKDAADELRLGMPVTVYLALDQLGANTNAAREIRRRGSFKIQVSSRRSRPSTFDLRRSEFDVRCSMLDVGCSLIFSAHHA